MYPSLEQDRSSRDSGSGRHFPAIKAANEFSDLLARLDRAARREHRTLPTTDERQSLNATFWDELMPTLAGAEDALDGTDLAQTRRDVQSILNPWLLRSRLWARSWLKPHGYPGDYRMLEWMYDLELDECADPGQPAAVNLLDGLYRSVHSVQAVWHRRAWFRNLIARYLRADREPVRVLDIACGGSRYVHDVIERYGPRAIAPTLFDQDPAALAYAESRLVKATGVSAATICAPVKRIEQALPVTDPRDRGRFDVVISTGLFDYLPNELARGLLAHMISLTRPGGTVAICNFGPEDRSRLVKEWVADWRLIYRTRAELQSLFPAASTPAFSESPDGGLLYARLSPDEARG